MINDAIKLFNENKNVLYKAYELDKTDFEFEYMKLIKIIEEYKTRQVPKKNMGAICITDGNPYITLHLCIQSILSESIILINNQDNMNNLNKVILDIFREISVFTPRIEKKITADKLYLFTENGREKIYIFNDKRKYERLISIGLPVIFKKIEID